MPMSPDTTKTLSKNGEEAETAGVKNIGLGCQLTTLTPVLGDQILSSDL